MAIAAAPGAPLVVDDLAMEPGEALLDLAKVEVDLPNPSLDRSTQGFNSTLPHLFPSPLNPNPQPAPAPPHVGAVFGAAAVRAGAVRPVPCQLEPQPMLAHALGTALHPVGLCGRT
eukprot:3214958-Prymnesium_polylepis.1